MNRSLSSRLLLDFIERQLSVLAGDRAAERVDTSESTLFRLELGDQAVSSTWMYRSLRRQSRQLGFGLRSSPLELTLEIATEIPDRKLLLMAESFQMMAQRRHLERELDETNAGMIAVWNDVESQRMRAEAATKTVEELSRSKDRFMAVLAHELRTPLAGMAMAIDELEGEVEDWAAPLRILSRQTRQLRRLVNDLLEVTRAEGGRLALDLGPHPIAVSLTAAVEMALGRAREAGLQLEYRPPSDSTFVFGDEDRLLQVWSNLIDNAIKYSDAGTIRVQVEVLDRVAQVIFADEGVGFQPEFGGRIFEPFVQEQDIVEATDMGLGLGLSLVHRLVELHSGRIEAHSAGRGRGATFTVELPLAAPVEVQRPSQPAPVDASPRPHRILFAEDDDDLRDLMLRALERRGCRVVAVASGMEALARLDDLDYDVMVFDLGMPDMGGLALAEEVRRRRPSAWLVAATGHGSKEAREQTRAAGFDDHLVKPIDVDELLRLIERERNDDQRSGPASS